MLDAWGFEKFLATVEDKLGRKLMRVHAEAIAQRPVYDRLAHIGVHPQKQPGLNWIGVTLKLGRLSPDHIRGLAKLAADFGDGDIRLTVWQNLLLSGISDADVPTVVAAIESLGLTTTASAIRAGLISCTGATGCRFAAAHTKENADEIATWCEERVQLQTPINIHLTGCHHTCAQHYIGDIGLIGARVPVNDDGDTVDGYHILVGGGYGVDSAIARELYQNVKASEAPQVVEQILKTFVANRASEEETFVQFTRRYEIDALKRLMTHEEMAA